MKLRVTNCEEEIDETLCILPLEEQAQFPGGVKDWNKFLTNQLQSIQLPTRETLGPVYLSFIVNEEGRVSEIAVVKSYNSDYNARAIQLMEKAPDWIPGKVNGRPVKMRMSIRLNICLK